MGHHVDQEEGGPGESLRLNVEPVYEDSWPVRSDTLAIVGVFEDGC